MFKITFECIGKCRSVTKWSLLKENAFYFNAFLCSSDRGQSLQSQLHIFIKTSCLWWKAMPYLENNATLSKRIWKFIIYVILRWIIYKIKECIYNIVRVNIVLKSKYCTGIHYNIFIYFLLGLTVGVSIAIFIVIVGLAVFVYKPRKKQGHTRWVESSNSPLQG